MSQFSTSGAPPTSEPEGLASPSNVGSSMNSREYSYFKNNSHRCLFLRDLPFHFRDHHLRDLAKTLLSEQSLAQLEVCRVKYSKETGKTLQVGIVMMRTVDAAQEFLNHLQRQPRRGGRDIRVNFFSPTAESEQSQDGAIQFTFDFECEEPLITEEVVRAHFEAEYGGLGTLSIRGHFFKQRAQNGFGFVSFQDENVGESLIGHGKSLERDGILYQFRELRNRGERPPHTARHSHDHDPLRVRQVHSRSPPPQRSTPSTSGSSSQVPSQSQSQSAHHYPPQHTQPLSLAYAPSAPSRAHGAPVSPAPGSAYGYGSYSPNGYAQPNGSYAVSASPPPLSMEHHLPLSAPRMVMPMNHPPSSVMPYMQPFYGQPPPPSYTMTLVPSPAYSPVPSTAVYGYHGPAGSAPHQVVHVGYRSNESSPPTQYRVMPPLDPQRGATSAYTPPPGNRQQYATYHTSPFYGQPPPPSYTMTLVPSPAYSPVPSTAVYGYHGPAGSAPHQVVHVDYHSNESSHPTQYRVMPPLDPQRGATSAHTPPPGSRQQHATYQTSAAGQNLHYPGSNAATATYEGISREYSYFKNNSHRCLFLRDLPFHFRDHHLRDLAKTLLSEQSLAQLEVCRVKYSKETGKTLQVGIVMMRTVDAAQ
eukprot:gene13041-9335_t